MEKKEVKKNKTNSESKKSYKFLILAIIIIVILAVAVILFSKFSTVEKGEDVINDLSQELIDKSTAAGNSSDTKNVIITDEGIKVNVSPKVVEEKTFCKFVIKDMNISSQSGNSVVTFSILNNSSQNIDNKEFTIELLDSNGKEINSISSTIENLEVGKEQIVYIHADSDLSNAYNYDFDF